MKSGWQNLAKARAEPGGYIYLKQNKTFREEPVSKPPLPSQEI